MMLTAPRIHAHRRLGAVVLGLIAPAMLTAADAAPAAAAKVACELTTSRFALVYSVDAQGALLNELRDLTGAAAPTMKGQVFPSRFIRSLKKYCHGQRPRGPLEVTLANGDTSLRLVYESHTITPESPDRDHALITVKDQDLPIRVDLHLRVSKRDGILEQWLVLRNGTSAPLQIDRLDSLYFQADNAKGTWLEWFDGTQNLESAKPERERLGRGTKLLESRHGNRHLNGVEPFIAMGFGAQPSEDQGPCLVAALAWSGSTRMAFTIDDPAALETSIGVNQPIPITVRPTESLTTPACVFTYSAAGKGTASRSFHRWMRTYGLRDGDRLRPVDNNSWEGSGFKVSEAEVIEMLGASADLGIELYVLDDGWFGNGATARVNDKAGLGDWQINRERFPNGFAPVLKAAQARNIAFGLWFEPEMVNQNSALFAAHPDWILQVPGRSLDLQRSQLVLDVANPAVQEHIFQAIDGVLRANPGIRFVKWDANASINNPYSAFLGAERQGELYHRYLNGYYAIQARLVAAHPQVDFQACSAGGGRADLGALASSHTFWPSDNTNPEFRLGAVWNYSLVMPALAMTSHVTHAGKGIPDKYRFDVSMMTQLGMEVDPRTCTPETLAAAKLGIADYKRIRDVVQFGDQYRHGHPEDTSTPSVNYVAASRGRAVVLAYQTAEITQPVTVTAPVAGLDPTRIYRAVELNLPAEDARPRLAPGAATSQSGAAWMAGGVPLVFTRRYDSAVIHLENAP